MIRKMSPFGALVVVLLFQGCASTPRQPVPKITAEIISSPEGIEMSYRGKTIGTAPLELEIDNLDEAVELAAVQDQPPIIERRIKILGPDRIQVTIRLGREPSPLAKALGLTKVVVFDYDSLITFDTDSYALREKLRPLLQGQAELLESHFKGLDVYVCGHTDATGGEEHNQILSVNRAQAVADYLIAQGLDTDRIRVQGFGKDYPLAANSTRTGRAANRRTEIVLPD